LVQRDRPPPDSAQGRSRAARVSRRAAGAGSHDTSLQDRSRLKSRAATATAARSEPGEGQVHQAGLDERHRPDGEAMLGRPCRLAAGTMAEAANSTMRFDLL